MAYASKCLGTTCSTEDQTRGRSHARQSPLFPVLFFLHQDNCALHFTYLFLDMKTTFMLYHLDLEGRGSFDKMGLAESGNLETGCWGIIGVSSLL